MSKLYTCYSPKGEKFELSRPNYLDATQNYGFTTQLAESASDEKVSETGENVAETTGQEGGETDSTENTVQTEAVTDANEGAADANEAGAADANEAGAADANEAGAADANEGAAAGTEAADEVELLIDASEFPEDKGEIKAYIDNAFPEAEYDKRMGRDDLIKFALEQAEEATA